MKLWRPPVRVWLGSIALFMGRAVDILYRLFGYRLVVYIDKRLPAKCVRRWQIFGGRWETIRMRQLYPGDMFCLEAEAWNPWICLAKPTLGWDLVWYVQAEPAYVVTNIPMLYGEILEALEEGKDLTQEQVDFIHRDTFPQTKARKQGEPYDEGDRYRAGYYNRDLCQ